MPYTYITRAQMRTLLAMRLGDAGQVFWTEGAGTYKELDLYLNEALRTWGALTAYWRERCVFQTVANTIFYDLPNTQGINNQNGPKDLLGYTVQDRDLVAMMQYHLLEPATGISWTGSEMWTLDDLTSSIERARNELLSEAGRVVTRSLLNVPPNPIGRIPIPDNIIDVRRLAWLDVDGVYSNLWREDEWGINAFSPNAVATPARPKVYSTTIAAPLQVQISPPAADIGQLEMLSVQTGATLDPTAGVLLGIPDDLSWIVKWGALADLLSGSALGRDPQRAQYCQERWAQGIQLAMLMPSVLQAFVNEVPVQVLSVADLDADSPNWQNVAAGPPKILAMGGPNLLAVSPKPDGVYSITLDVARNAPIPAADGDKTQISREEMDAIIEYAFHLACFKQGGDEFTASNAQLQELIQMAALRNSKLRTQSAFFDALGSLAIREEQIRPRRETDTGDGGQQQ